MALSVLPTYVNFEAEAILIGMAVSEPLAAKWIATHGRAEWFVGQDHAAAFRAIRKLHDARIGINSIAIIEQAKADHDGVSPLPVTSDYLLDCAERVPSTTQYAEYGQMVSMYWRKRELAARVSALGEELATDCGPADLERLIGKTRQLATGLEWFGDSTTYLADIDVSANHGLGLPTGFEQIDQRTSCRGIPMGSVTLVVAPRKTGKTVIGLQMFRDFAFTGTAAFVTLEMTPDQLKRSLIRQSSGMWRTPSQDQPELIAEPVSGEPSKRAKWDSAVAQVDALGGSPIHAPRGDERTVEAVCAWIEDRHRTAPVDAYVIDYAQKLRSANARRFGGNPVSELEYVSGLIAATAATVNAPILLLAQSSDQAAKDAMEIQVKGSRAFEQDCALMLAICRTDGKVSAAIRANRFGPSDVEVHLQWDASRTVFREYGHFDKGRWVTG